MFEWFHYTKKSLISYSRPVLPSHPCSSLCGNFPSYDDFHCQWDLYKIVNKYIFIFLSFLSIFFKNLSYFVFILKIFPPHSLHSSLPLFLSPYFLTGSHVTHTDLKLNVSENKPEHFITVIHFPYAETATMHHYIGFCIG